MTHIDDLFWSAPSRWTGTLPEMDPLRESDALLEAQLLDVRVHAVTSTVGLLFELRTALQLQAANTAVLMARRVRDLGWSADPRSGLNTAWTVIGSEPRYVDHVFLMELKFWPSATISLVAESAEFYVVDADGLSLELSDYVEDEPAEIRANTANWQSTFAPVAAAYVGAHFG